MDRRTIIGFGIIVLLVFGWSMYNQKVDAERAAVDKRKFDSISKIKKAEEDKRLAARQRYDDSIAKLPKDSTGQKVNLDSMRLAQRKARYGVFAEAMTGEAKPLIIENELIRAEIYPLGGRIGSVTLKKFKTHEKQPLVLFTPDSSNFGVEFMTPLSTHESQPLNTDTLYFKAQGAGFAVAGKDSKSLTMRLSGGAPDKYIDFVYTLTGNSYLVDCKMNIVGMKDAFASNTNALTLQWDMAAPAQEQLVDNERRYSTIGYLNNDTKEYDNISEAKYEKLKLTGNVRWIDFKQQYFSSVLVTDKPFNGGELETRAEINKRYVKHMGATLPIAYMRNPSETVDMKFYFGPNDYRTLKSYDLELEKSVYFGWWIIGYLNHYAIMPLFNGLASLFTNNMGLVILLLTIIVKIVIFPIAYRSYLSQAKMRVLKPEIDALNAKYKDGDPMQKQQAQMALYRKAGINPAAGCIPLLLQLPILFALIRFFPLAFDLRQQGFLWCDDLSSYDSIITFGFKIPLYGDHVSLWALLMTASTLVYTWMNSSAMSSQASLPGMKVMMYVMPVFFLVFLNNYSAALSFYYFVANVINILQMMLMRRFVDEGKIRAAIEANKKKPAKQGRMQAYLDRVQKQQQDRVKQLQQQKGKKK